MANNLPNRLSIDEIAEYWSQETEHDREHWYSWLRQAITGRSENPEKFPKHPELIGHPTLELATNVVSHNSKESTVMIMAIERDTFESYLSMIGVERPKFWFRDAKVKKAHPAIQENAKSRSEKAHEYWQPLIEACLELDPQKSNKSETSRRVLRQFKKTHPYNDLESKASILRRKW